MIAQCHWADCILTPTTGRHNPSGRRRLWKDLAGESEPAERPLRVLGEDCVARRGQFRKARADFRVARLARAQPGISDRDARVAHQPAPLRALHGASAKHFAKFLFGERDQPFQVRRKKRVLSHAGAAGNSAAPSPARGDSTGKRPGKCRSRRRAAHGLAQFSRESRRATQSSGRKCSAARPERTARRSRPSGTRRCTGCNSRTNPAPALPPAPSDAREIERRHDHAEKKPRPNSSLMRQVFFASQPSPAYFAATRSTIGPVST